MITIFPPSRGHPPQFETQFALQQDLWNDYSFQTLYHLYRRGSEAELTPTLIGPVKILRRGQTERDGIQIRAPFELLPEDCCSVGSSLDYYQRLNEIPSQERDNILTALRDVVAAPSLAPLFEGERGWSISLFRDNPRPSEFLSD